MTPEAKITKSMDFRIETDADILAAFDRSRNQTGLVRAAIRHVMGVELSEDEQRILARVREAS